MTPMSFELSYLHSTRIEIGSLQQVYGYLHTAGHLSIPLQVLVVCRGMSVTMEAEILQRLNTTDNQNDKD